MIERRVVAIDSDIGQAIVSLLGVLHGAAKGISIEVNRTQSGCIRSNKVRALVTVELVNCDD